jgi:hypothetical protein
MTEKVLLVGRDGEPENWFLGNELWKTLPLNDDMFTREFSSYDECRKFVLGELKAKRKLIGREMDYWLCRSHLKGVKNGEVQRAE